MTCASTSEELGASLFRLYLGGRTYVPEAANVYADTATALHSLTPAVESLAAGLDHEVGETFTEMARTVHLALSRTAINLDLAGTALVQIADRFSRTDEAARDEFERLRRRQRNALTDPPSAFSRPPMPEDRQPDFPHGSMREA
jgi:hypothetical protein